MTSVRVSLHFTQALRCISVLRFLRPLSLPSSYLFAFEEKTNLPFLEFSRNEGICCVPSFGSFSGHSLFTDDMLPCAIHPRGCSNDHQEPAQLWGSEEDLNERENGKVHPIPQGKTQKETAKPSSSSCLDVGSVLRKVHHGFL